MSADSYIEWTDHTYNHWIGCKEVSPGCAGCYARAWAERYGRDFENRTRTKTGRDPLKWNKRHAAFFAKHGRRQVVFCASLSDVFDNAVPAVWRKELFDLIRATPNLDWMILTKRIGNAAAMITEAGGWPANAVLGITVVNQPEIDRDVIKLICTPVTRRFLSMEPLLAPADLTGEYLAAKCGTYPFKGLPGEHRTRLIDLLDLVIVGGESGPKARPMHPAWVTDLRDQCAAAGVPFMFKQWGEWKPISQMSEPETNALYVSVKKARGSQDQRNLDDIYGRRCKVPTSAIGFGGDVGADVAFKQVAGRPGMQLFRVGKKKSGRLLDGCQWNGTIREDNTAHHV